MVSKFFAALAAISLLGVSAPAWAQTNSGSGEQTVQQLNRNPQADSTLSWKEIVPAAQARFQQLDTNHDGTLSKQEAAKAGITSAEFQQANTKGHHTLSQQEYLAFVKTKFEAANPNQDQTLSSRELNTPAGQSLRNLLATSG